MDEGISGSGQRRLCKRDFWKTIVERRFSIGANSGMKFSTDDRNLRNSVEAVPAAEYRGHAGQVVLFLYGTCSPTYYQRHSAFSSGALTTRWTIPDGRNTLVPMRSRLEKLRELKIYLPLFHRDRVCSARRRSLYDDLYTLLPLFYY